MEKVDHALFERKFEEAIVASVVFHKWAEKDLHFRCRSTAVMSSVYSVCGLSSLAEEKIITAKALLPPGCKDCRAHYAKRLGTYYVHRNNPRAAEEAYTQSIELFSAESNLVEMGRSMLNRGVARAFRKDFSGGLKDEENALELIESRSDFRIIAASVNIAAMYTEQGMTDEAMEKIEETQAMLLGTLGLERPKLILRWMKGLLLENQCELRRAGDILDRVEVRMKKHDMKPELRILYADRARIAQRPAVVEKIILKAYDLEDLPSVRAVIKTALKNPSMDNLMKWRRSLDAYVPPFPATA